MICVFKWLVKYIVFNSFKFKAKPKSKVFTYHNITRRKSFDDYSVSIKMFERHVNLIHQMDYKIVSFENVQDIKSERFVVFTFDDGFSGIIDAAYVLKKYNFSATFFITTNFVGRKGFVSWSDLLKLKELGFQIGSHSLSHDIISNLNNLESVREFRESKKCIERKLNTFIDLFAFPYGQKNTFNDKHIVELRREGYSKCFTQIPINQNKADLENKFIIGRTGVMSFYNLKTFRALI